MSLPVITRPVERVSNAGAAKGCTSVRQTGGSPPHTPWVAIRGYLCLILRLEVVCGRNSLFFSSVFSAESSSMGLCLQAGAHSPTAVKRISTKALHALMLPSFLYSS